MSKPDAIAYYRDRVRAADRRVDHLEWHRARLERLLVLALDVATANGRDCDRLVLLEALEQVAQIEARSPSIPELVKLLRETDPDAARRAA